MYLREKLDELKLTKQKIKELSAYVINNPDAASTDGIVKELLKYMDDAQNIKLVLDKVNVKTVLNIGQSKLDMTTAVIIRDNIKSKIDFISSIIENNTVLDLLTLIKQRDAFIEEYNSINKVIRVTDWSVKLD